ncbi:acyl-CoA N-acyltransferase [Coniochaeta sp. 2T2.1]|nr:acyl-CoA N-acyltransferase [Coniochaeta sp. 2T2.1]
MTWLGALLSFICHDPSMTLCTPLCSRTYVSDISLSLRQDAWKQETAPILHRMSSQFHISTPLTADVARIASIHVAAMDSNTLLHAQFPDPETLGRLRTFLENYLTNELTNPKAGILVARDAVTDEIVSYAKWDYPSSGGDDDKGKVETGDLRNMEGCRREFLERYTALAEQAKKRAFGEGPCYHLAFVCTDPEFQRLGAGSLLTRHIMEKARADGMVIYLESTLDTVHMYERLGFRKVDAFQMKIPRPGGDPEDLSGIYEEVCMVWWPNETRSPGIPA